MEKRRSKTHLITLNIKFSKDARIKLMYEVYDSRAVDLDRKSNFLEKYCILKKI